jgi:hypothetical protein
MDHLPPKPLKIALGLFRNLQTFAEIFAQARCIIGINDTGGKFAANIFVKFKKIETILMGY